MARKRRQYLHRYSRRSGGWRRGRDRLVSKRSVVGYKLSTMAYDPRHRLQELGQQIRSRASPP